MQIAPEIQVTALRLHGETYVWLWTDASRLARSVGSFAANPELSIDWYHAALVMQDARRSAADERCMVR